ncbi:MAG: GNAT family N-acetyltransferase [Rubrivivax sp.]|nr:GNAT family N-acetyltransferase [Rubrivivax sp.]MDP3084579.1 GNAT family N-acetyltransferase [Rubrivivax sp.]
MSGFAADLLSRVEDAGLNASAPPQQRWVDGWLIRFSPAKAKRARCINAVAAGRLPLAQKLALAEAVFAAAGLPMVVRITPFTQPPSLDSELAGRGWHSIDDTRVMVCPSLPADLPLALPAGHSWQPLPAAGFAEAVGAMRGSPAAQRAAHAQRLQLSPVPLSGLAICRDDDGAVLACGHSAIEAEWVGLYDVFTIEPARGRGLARLLCQRLLSLAAQAGARGAYLQVDAGNLPARTLYGQLGFSDGYAYHYRTPDPAAA